MVDVQYANAYVEVLAVLNNLIKTDYEKIPNSYIEYLYANCNKEYNFNYDCTKDFSEQNLMIETKYVLFYLFEKFGATDEMLEKIKKYKKYYCDMQDDKKRTEYDPNKIFTKTEKTQIAQTSTELVEVETENFFVKILNSIKKFFSNK